MERHRTPGAPKNRPFPKPFLPELCRGLAVGSCADLGQPGSAWWHEHRWPGTCLSLWGTLALSWPLASAKIERIPFNNLLHKEPPDLIYLKKGSLEFTLFICSTVFRVR